MNKKQKLELVLNLIKEHNFTAYEIGKNTKISTFAVQKIINGDTKNPNETTLDSILEFIEYAIVGTDIKQKKNNVIEEPSSNYEKSDVNISKYIDCLETVNKLRIEISRLTDILRNNNIAFEEKKV